MSTAIGQEEEEFKAPKFTKADIGESGATAYFPESDGLLFTSALSEDGAVVYTGEVSAGEFNYGIIFVRFKDLSLDTQEDRELTLISYLDFLKSSFSIVSSAGYGLGHRLARDESAEGIIDYWFDSDGDAWSVNGWVRPDGLAVMFIYGAEEYPNISVANFFFNGLQF